METIKVIVAGPRGRMGREAVKLIHETAHFELAAVLDRKQDYSNIKHMEGFQDMDAPVYTDAEACFSSVKADVLVDLTTPETGMFHTEAALRHGIRPVVGTTGFSGEDLEKLDELTKDTGLGCIIAPNFATGAVLMMKFSQMAAKYFPDIEIIEMHHDQKLDAPSGTAVKTADLISKVRETKTQGHQNEKETIQGARGADVDGMHIHSVRLPGLVAHQQVMFGADGQMLTIRHDSFNRASFMSGVRLAVETIMKLDVLVYGLENIME
ncbi:4-hydroxy-tetrahydrodipicolinate reductase [Bacillus sp. MUM 13]|uniref:4-hydroxy-tetrahydrodipicolinate reductase n=1 Tax=Bacillus sp. MUM 13 TaxID=1678001 RepID=UPI0008F5BC22|nr:4-hydroxy-tetrahydrodipicolinate reductase [Bacillus sp. MUM 13]OIK12307.1 4-hydroxy-tetrahydrodipicolinate reductase [Bacillus sp. MUM 13]